MFVGVGVGGGIETGFGLVSEEKEVVEWGGMVRLEDVMDLVDGGA